MDDTIQRDVDNNKYLLAIDSINGILEVLTK